MALTSSEILVNKRFIECSSQLKNNGTVASIRELMEKLDLHEQYYTRYKNNLMALPYDAVKKLNELFGVNKDWLWEGKGEMFEQGELVLLKPISEYSNYKTLYEGLLEKCKILEELVKSKEETIQGRDQLIQSLIEQRDEYKRQLTVIGELTSKK